MANRAVLVADVGDPQTWRIVTKEKPTASAGEVLVRITLSPVNPTDIRSPKFYLSHFGPNRIVTGSEGVGYVEEVGENVTKVKKGQRVVPLFRRHFYGEGNGSWQDYGVFSEDELFILPNSITDEVAAQFVVNPWTVYRLLSDQNLSKGDWLLQQAAGSVVGRLVIQLAKHWGIKTINVVRRDNVKEELKKLGADEVINSSTEDVAARVKEITGGKLAAGALDPVAGEATQAIASSVKDGGKVFIYGPLGRAPGSKDFTSTVNIFDLGRVQISFWTLLHLKEEKRTPAFIAAEVIKLLEEKVFEPLSGKKFKLEEFKEALAEAEKSGRGGKVFLSR